MQNLRDHIDKLFQDSVKRLFLGWDRNSLAYDVSFAFVPTPAGPQPAFVIPVAGPSPLLGHKIVNIIVITAWADMDQKSMDEIVISAWEQMNTTRQQSLSTQNGGKHG